MSLQSGTLLSAELALDIPPSRQLMIRAGLELMQKEYPDEGLKSVYVISKSAEDRDWMVKLWVELRMLLHESRFKPGLMKPGELPMMWGIPGNGKHWMTTSMRQASLTRSGYRPTLVGREFGGL